MPVYKLSKEHRAKILNVPVETHDKAHALIKAQREKYPPTKHPETGELVHDIRSHLSWHDALRTVEPDTQSHPDIPTNLVDNGHHDHGDFHTMTVSTNVAKLLVERLGVDLTFHHKIHHVPPPKPESTEIKT